MQRRRITFRIKCYQCPSHSWMTSSRRAHSWEEAVRLLVEHDWRTAVTYRGHMRFLGCDTRRGSIATVHALRAAFRKRRKRA